MASGGARNRTAGRRGADPNLSRVASKLGRVRLARGLTQQELAEQAGLGKRTGERYDQGQGKNPPLRQLLALAAVLECSVDDLIEDSWRPPERRP